jgi:hypothetical protein
MELFYTPTAARYYRTLIESLYGRTVEHIHENRSERFVEWCGELHGGIYFTIRYAFGLLSIKLGNTEYERKYSSPIVLGVCQELIVFKEKYNIYVKKYMNLAHEDIIELICNDFKLTMPVQLVSLTDALQFLGITIEDNILKRDIL